MPDTTFSGYERFVYRLYPVNDCSPHAVWDQAKCEWSDVGAFATESAARACALGMNKMRQAFRQKNRALDDVLYDLQRAVRSIEAVSKAVA